MAGIRGGDAERGGPETRPFWLRFRTTMVLMSAPGWPVIRAAMEGDFSQRPGWHFVPVISGFAVFAPICMSVIHSRKIWEPPSWRANPMDRDRPAEGIHLAGWSCLSGAAGLAIAAVFRSTPDWSIVLPGALGLGLLVGARLVAILVSGRRT